MLPLLGTILLCGVTSSVAALFPVAGAAHQVGSEQWDPGSG